MKSIAGDVIDFPKPRLPVKVPPKEDHTSQVTVPLYLFSTVFGLLQTNGGLDLDITPEMVSGLWRCWVGTSAPGYGGAAAGFSHVVSHSLAEPVLYKWGLGTLRAHTLWSTLF